jgi:hypothetical protein
MPEPSDNKQNDRESVFGGLPVEIKEKALKQIDDFLQIDYMPSC